MVAKPGAFCFLCVHHGPSLTEPEELVYYAKHRGKFMRLRPRAYHFAGFIFLSSLLLSPPTHAKKNNADPLEDEKARLLADTVLSVTTIRQEIQQLKGAVEELKYFYQEETKKNEKLMRDFDMRVTSMEEITNQQSQQMKDFLHAAPAKASKAGSANEDTLYRQALAEVNTQNFKQAITLFNDFMKKFPKSNLADNAQYWKGEALFALKDYPNSVMEFQKVVTNYPKSDKVPGAILKQGYAFTEIKEYNDAKAFFQRVIAKYPQSSEAAIAKERIEKIDQTLSKSIPTPAASHAN